MADEVNEVANKSHGQLRALIDEGLRSGVGDRTVEDIWAEAEKLESMEG